MDTKTRTTAGEPHPNTDLLSIAALPELLDWRIRRTPSGEAYRSFDRQTGRWRSLSWQAVGEEVRRRRLALDAEGLEKGDRAAILLPSGVEHVAIDQAALAEGLVPVPMHALDNPESIAYILRDCAARLLFVDSTRAVARDPQVRRRRAGPQARRPDDLPTGRSRGGQPRHLPRPMALRRRCGRPAPGKDRLRRSGRDRLHVGNDRAAEGGHALARQHPRQRQGERRAPVRRLRRRFPVFPAAVAYARAHLRLLLPDRGRRRRRLFSFGERPCRRPQGGAPDGSRVRAENLRAVLCAHHGAPGGARARAARDVRSCFGGRRPALRRAATRQKSLGERPDPVAPARQGRGRARASPTRRTAPRGD